VTDKQTDRRRRVEPEGGGRGGEGRDLMNEVLVERVEEKGECGDDPGNVLSLNGKPCELTRLDLIDVLVDCEEVLQTADEVMLVRDHSRNLMQWDVDWGESRQQGGRGIGLGGGVRGCR
jgi:hypothetical protein